MFTKCLHDVEALVLTVAHLQDYVAFLFGMPEQRVKAVNFDVCKKAQKLISYHSNVPWATTKLMSVLTKLIIW